MIKSGNYDPSKSKSWKVLETVLSRLKKYMQTTELFKMSVHMTVVAMLSSCIPIYKLQPLTRFLAYPISFSDRDGLKLSRGSSGGATPFTFNPCLSRTCGKKKKKKKRKKKHDCSIKFLLTTVAGLNFQAKKIRPAGL